MTTRVSVASDGTQGNDSSYDPSISADGRYVAFDSTASNLVAGDTNGYSDVFVHNRQTQLTTRASVASDGSEGNNDSFAGSISADGRYVAFHSMASNLVAGDTNGCSDVFIHDRQTQQTTRVSVASDGSEGNNDSFAGSISADGRYVAFCSSATNLVAGDTNGKADVFVHDRQMGQTTRVSVASDGTQGNDSSYDPSISADGRYVAFKSYASNLVSGDTNGEDIFVRDRQTQQTTRVSVASGGTQANSWSQVPSISADGRYVAFESMASNLVAGDTNWTMDIFVHDRQTQQTTRVSVASGGTQANSWSQGPSISADGRYVAFHSAASNLIAGDTNGYSDDFIHDRQTQQTTRVSVASDGSEGNNDSFAGSISADGRYVAFRSYASNLVPGDTNGYPDIFVHDREAGPTPTPTPTPTPPGLPDLSIDSVVPVQVLEGEDLVLNKSTAVKVVVRKTGTDSLSDVQAKVTFAGYDYTTFYVSEAGNWDSNFVLQQPNTTYPLNFASDEITKTVYFFADGLAPASTGAYQVSATVDYQAAIAEANEGNNTASSATLQVRDTNWTGNRHPDLYVRYFRSDWGSTSDSLFYDYHNGSRHYILAAYPVAPVDFQTSFAEWWEGNSTFWRGLDGRLNNLEFLLWTAQLSIEGRLSTPTADRFISVMPPGWFANYTTDMTDAAGVAFPSIRTLVFAEVLTNRQGTARYVPAAHELGHSYSLRLDCEEYYFQDANCPEKMQQHAPPDRIGESVTGGLWVEQRALMEHSAQHPVYCFMGAASDVTYWVDSEDYSRLRDDHEAKVSAATLGAASANEAILVVGRAFITGTVELDDWYILPEAQPDDLPPGDYRLRYLDAGNSLLYEHPFDISFTVEGITTTVAPFVFTAPHVPGTARIVVRYQTTDLAEKTVSSNAPTVTVLSPNGGEVLPGQTTIDWSASDADGDPLSYAVLYSVDGGTTWNTLATDVDTTSYEWDLSGLPPGSNYLVKVIATDAFNTGQDASDATFSVGYGIYVPLILKNY